jgi:hypothetical protein
MEERRELNTRIVTFMAKAEEKLETIHVDIIELNKKVAIQNGRVSELEHDRSILEGKRLLVKQISWVSGGVISLVTLLVLIADHFKK